MPRNEDLGPSDCCVRLVGLPWSAKEEEIRNFFSDCSEGIEDLTFTYNRNGKPSGEAYVKFTDEDSTRLAIAHHTQHIGKRYIEVFGCKRADMDSAANGYTESSVGDSENILRLRGLPYSATKREVIDFFPGLNIVANGILVPTDEMGRNVGEAFVQFADAESASKAMEKNMQTMGRRYIEIFRSSEMEVKQTMWKLTNGGGSSDSGGGGGPMGGSVNRGPRGGGNTGRGGGNQSQYDYGYGSYGYGNGGYGDSQAGYGYGGSDGYNNFGYGGSYGGSMGGGPMMGGHAYMQQGQQRAGPYGGARRGGGGGGGFGGPGQGGMMMGGGAGMGMGGGHAMGGSAQNQIGPQAMMGGGEMGGGFSAAQEEPSHMVKMRGLPFRATETEVRQFFSPLEISTVEIIYNDRGKPSGDAEVYFNTHSDAVAAMKRDHNEMGSRYIELFINSTPQTKIAGGMGHAGGMSAYGW